MDNDGEVDVTPSVSPVYFHMSSNTTDVVKCTRTGYGWPYGFVLRVSIDAADSCEEPSGEELLTKVFRLTVFMHQHDGSMRCGTLGSVAHVLRERGLGPFDPRTSSFPAPPGVSCARVHDSCLDADDKADVVIDIPLPWNFIDPFSSVLEIFGRRHAIRTPRVRVEPFVYFTMHSYANVLGLSLDTLDTLGFERALPADIIVVPILLLTVSMPKTLVWDVGQPAIVDVHINGSPTTGRLTWCCLDASSYILTLVEPTSIEHCHVILAPELTDIPGVDVLVSVILDERCGL